MSGFDSGRTGASVVASLNRADQLPDPAGHPAGRAIRSTGNGAYAVEAPSAEALLIAGPAPTGSHSSDLFSGRLIYQPPWHGNPNARVVDPVRRIAWNTDFGLDFNAVFPVDGQGGQYGSGCVGPDNKLYFAPWGENEFLVIDPSDNTAVKTDFGTSLGAYDYNGLGTTVSGVNAHSYGLVHGANGKLYTIPYSLNRAPVIVDVAAGTAAVASYANIMTGGVFTLFELWNGGALAPNGKIYCSPYNRADQVLVIDTSDDTAVLTNFGLDLAGLGTYRFGRPTLGPDGKIYMPPYNVNKALVIDPETDTAVLEDWGLPFAAGRFAYYASVLGPDGKIYCPDNSSTDGMLIIDPLNNSAEFGPMAEGNGPVIVGDDLWLCGSDIFGGIPTSRVRLR